MLEQIAIQLEERLMFGLDLTCEFRPNYHAYASATEEGYLITYHIGEDTPAYQIEEFGTVQDCVKEMVKVSVDWTEAE
jgi:hypothetical protein